MSKREFLSWYDWLQTRMLSAIDNVIATPFNNGEFIWTVEEDHTCPNPYDPYHDTNNSYYASLFQGAVALFAVLGVIFASIINFYKKNRRNEGVSNYFFFDRLFYLIEQSELEIFLRERSNFRKRSTPYAYLHAVAYFYNPDISPIVLWTRRAWAFISLKSNFYNLENYLKQQQKDLNKTKLLLLEEIYGEINEKLIIFINSKKKFGKWKTEKKEGKWFIRLSQDYVKDGQIKKNIQISENNVNLEERENSNLSFICFIKYRLKGLREFINDKKKLYLSFRFIEHRLKELGDASFVYWIFVFLFYFIPGYCLPGVIVWPPILIASIFLVGVWLTKVRSEYKGWQFKQQISSANPEAESKQRAEQFLTQAIKYQIKLEALLSQKTESGTFKYKKVKFIEKTTSNLNYKESSLYKEIKGVLKTKNDFLGVRAIFNGFISGCFTIYFSFWLLGAALSLVVSLNPLGVALVTLVLGLSYGVYSAIKYYKQGLEVLSEAEEGLAKLEKDYGDIEIPDISLRALDRLFRRGTTHPSVWTVTKQFSKRLWTGFIRWGTGVLFLKLAALRTILAIVNAIKMSTLSTTILAGATAPVILISFPTLVVIMVMGGLLFTAWHVWQYHCESKEVQTARIMDFLLNAPANFQDGSVCPAIIDNINNNVPCPEKYRVPTGILDKHERAVRSMYNGSNRFLKLRRQSSNSEPCLNEQIELNDTAFSTSQFWQANNSRTIGQVVEEDPFRKRSSTLPPDIRTRKQAIDSQALATLLLTNHSTLFNCGNHESSSLGSKNTLSQSSLIASCS